MAPLFRTPILVICTKTRPVSLAHKCIDMLLPLRQGQHGLSHEFAESGFSTLKAGPRNTVCLVKIPKRWMESRPSLGCHLRLWVRSLTSSGTCPLIGWMSSKGFPVLSESRRGGVLFPAM